MKEKYKKRLGEYRYFYHPDDDPVYFNRKMSIFGDSLEEDPSGETAEFCMWRFESTGVMPPCSDIEGFRILLAGKGARDWHITNWGEDLARGLLTKAELIEDGVPQSLIAAASKARYKKFAHIRSERCA